MYICRYYRGAKAAICVFDLTNNATFERISTWIKDLRNHADPNVVICIAGNKCDKPGASKDISSYEEYAKSIGATFFITSALTGIGVQEIFENLSRNVYEVYQSTRRSNSKNDKDKLKLNTKPVETQKTCC